MTQTSAIWAVVPAAGIGTRMNAVIPKQYLPLDGRPVLEHTLKRLLSIEQVSGLVVSVRDDDQHWSSIKLDTDKPVIRAVGGNERNDSVLNALKALKHQPGFNQDDWVLVHDAVRPCVQQADIELLISTVDGNNSGGLLALPVRDTMKRQNSDLSVKQSVDRTGLWHALTPQLFPWKKLYQALEATAKVGVPVTDESSAMEHAGYNPVLVQGHDDNIKITRPGDLRLAELYLQDQQAKSTKHEA